MFFAVRCNVESVLRNACKATAFAGSALLDLERAEADELNFVAPNGDLQVRSRLL